MSVFLLYLFFLFIQVFPAVSTLRVCMFVLWSVCLFSIVVGLFRYLVIAHHNAKKVPSHLFSQSDAIVIGNRLISKSVLHNELIRLPSSPGSR